jgi:hypothetical protein
MNEENNVPKKTSPWVVLVAIVVIAGAITGYLLLKPGSEGGRTGRQPEILEYTDTKYDYAFQYPSYWEVQKSPPGYDFGEARVLLLGPSGSSVVALVSDIEKSMSKDEFNNDPNNGEIVMQMMDQTIKDVYQKIAGKMGANRMYVAEKEILPSEVSIQFYISAVNLVDTTAQMAVAGIHAVPFGEKHMISFLGSSFPNAEAEEENQVVSLILGSFHLLEEKPRE